MRRKKPDRRGRRTALPVIRIDAAPDVNDVVTADVPVTIGRESMRLALTVPAGPTPVRDLLPVFRGLADVVAGVGVRTVESRGERVSCRAGCGACCRQAVPVSESEARAIGRLVAAMPEPRQTQVRERFAAAIRKLDESGLLEPLRGATPGSAAQGLGLAYFQLGIPCPFLEDESCSIHRDRPVACREYLVTSPAEECGRPGDERVVGVPLPARVGDALRAIDRQSSEIGCVALVLALEWTAANPEASAALSGPDVIRRFLAALADENRR